MNDTTTPADVADVTTTTVAPVATTTNGVLAKTKNVLSIIWNVPGVESGIARYAALGLTRLGLPAGAVALAITVGEALVNHI